MYPDCVWGIERAGIDSMSPNRYLFSFVDAPSARDFCCRPNDTLAPWFRAIQIASLPRSAAPCRIRECGRYLTRSGPSSGYGAPTSLRIRHPWIGVASILVSGFVDLNVPLFLHPAPAVSRVPRPFHRSVLRSAYDRSPPETIAVGTLIYGGVLDLILILFWSVTGRRDAAFSPAVFAQRTQTPWS